MTLYTQWPTKRQKPTHANGDWLDNFFCWLWGHEWMTDCSDDPVYWCSKCKGRYIR